MALLQQLIFIVYLFHLSHCEFSVHGVPKTVQSLSNFYLKRCTYSRQCDEAYGYVCRDGGCTCKFGRPDPRDLFKCKVQVKLGDFCAEIPSSKRSKGAVYVRRKCPHNAECGTQGICECDPLFHRKGGHCIPRVLKAGDNKCTDHMDCLVERGQQCWKGFCVECAVGGFKNFKPEVKWVEAHLECTCYKEEINNLTLPAIRHSHHKKGSCTSPSAPGDHCTTPQNCLSPWTPSLTCLEGTCQCPPATREYTSPAQPLTTLCISPINSPCTSPQDCHPPTSYCETRLEMPLCKCKEGYELQGRDQFTCVSPYYEETCGKFSPPSEKLLEHLKQQRLSCIKGIYECARPRDMYWDRERGKCISFLGGRCDLDLSDVTSCAGELGLCWEYKKLGEFRCQCPLGEGEKTDNYDFTNRNENSFYSGDNSRPVYKPSRDRRDCVRAES